MAYFILFLFVAYVAPVLFLAGVEKRALSHSVEKPAKVEHKGLVGA